MARSVPEGQRADETVTVRLPYGTAAKVRAATGQPFSTIVRWMVVQLLAKHSTDASVKEALRENVQRTVGEVIEGDE